MNIPQQIVPWAVDKLVAYMDRHAHRFGYGAATAGRRTSGWYAPSMLERKGGATLAEIGKAMGWQNHTARGFISGTLGKKMELTVESFKNDQGEQAYRLLRK